MTEVVTYVQYTSGSSTLSPSAMGTTALASSGAAPTISMGLLAKDGGGGVVIAGVALGVVALGNWVLA